MAKNLEISLLLDFYGQMLTEKQQEVVEFYYNEDLSLAEIAQHSGITRQGVRDSIKRAESQLLEYEAKLGLYSRFHQIQDNLGEIVRQTEILREENQRVAFSKEVERCSQKIIEIANSMNMD